MTEGHVASVLCNFGASARGKTRGESELANGGTLKLRNILWGAFLLSVIPYPSNFSGDYKYNK